MPAMLGWFNMTATTSYDDVNWLLARSAGFNAGFALCTSEGVLKQNGDGEKMLEAIKQWEKARLGGAFSEDQKKRMRDIKNEFVLNFKGTNSWELVEVGMTLTPNSLS